MLHRKIKITGKVQGVFFRATAKQVADQLHLTGWVRNVQDGNVEAFVSGNDEAVNAFIAWCKQGPPMAEVEQVRVEETTYEKTTGFEIRR